ncbi:transporter, putative [hydrothermal vent metagenome]|uniref:Transporter, putative n=1 Tax=hydrothermal vent metagenome TaxID=652676 RepID=A0A3B0ZNS3_9ZZZZ
MKIINTCFQKPLSIAPGESKATLASFLFVLILMASYFILRPVRDAMASDWSDLEVSFLWNINFFVSTGIVALYGYAVSKLKFRNVVPIIYTFFASSFIIFYFVVSLVADRQIVDKIFYLWVSVFSLFHVSVFWSFMADIFSRAQAKRLFPFIAAGASTGALIGPIIPAMFATTLGVETLMLVASCGLMLVIPLIFYIYQQKTTSLGNTSLNINHQQKIIGGNWWSGFRTLVRNPYFFSIGIFILLYVFIGSFIYFAQKNLLAEYSRVERIQILGSIDWLVNLLTFGLAFFATGRIIKKFGMPITLAMVPLFVLACLIILAFAPLISIVLALQVARRAGSYAITRPAREMLFTEVSEEERYKAKPVVDIVVYRGGDAVSGTLFAILTDGIGFGLAAVAVVGAGIAGVWTFVAIRLGRRYESKTECPPNDVDSQTKAVVIIEQT